MYEIGDTYTKTVLVTDSTGSPVNASSVSCTITLPDLTTVTPTPTNPTTGTYLVTFPLTQGGHYDISVVGTGTGAFADNDVFNVAGTPPGFIISLSEARRGLGLQVGNTVSDEDLRSFIAGATPIMEDLIGPIVARTRVETYDGGRPQIALLGAPIKSVTTVIESYGSSYQRTLTLQDIFSGGGTDSYAYTVDLTGGILTRRAAGVAVCFVGGVRNIQVAYVAGQTLTGNHLLATRRLIRHLWQSEQQGFRPAFGAPDSMGTTPSGFAVPRAVIELCAGSTRAPGIG